MLKVKHCLCMYGLGTLPTEAESLKILNCIWRGPGSVCSAVEAVHLKVPHCSGTHPAGGTPPESSLAIRASHWTSRFGVRVTTTGEET